MLPLEALAEFEGRDDASVRLEAVALARTIASWTDREYSQSREDEVIPVERLKTFLDPPTSWLSRSLVAGRSGRGIGDRLPRQLSLRLGCVQIRDGGDGHQFVATVIEVNEDPRPVHSLPSATETASLPHRRITRISS